MIAEKGDFLKKKKKSILIDILKIKFNVKLNIKKVAKKILCDFKLLDFFFHWP